jgi:hypothetical protein
LLLALLTAFALVFALPSPLLAAFALPLLAAGR